MIPFTIITRALPARRACRLGLGLGLAGLLLAPALQAAKPKNPGRDGLPDLIVAGTMPEDYIPGLKTVIENALKQSPSMILQQIQIAVNEAGLLGADAALYPHLSAGGSYGWNDESVGQAGESGGSGSKSTGTSKSLSYNVGASMPIFQWGAVWNSTRMTKLTLLIQQKSYDETYRTLVVQLRDSFLALMAKKLNLRNAEYYQKTIIEAQYALAQDQLKNGMISSGAIIGPKLAVEDGRLALDRAGEEYLHAKRVLALLAGMKAIDDDSVPADMPQVTYAGGTADLVLAAFLREGAKSTFQATNLEMTIRQQQLNLRIQQVQQLPKFSANAGYSLVNSTSISLNSAPLGQTPTPASIAQVGVTSESYGISASWDIFDGFAAQASIRSARQNKRYYERQLQTYLETTLEQAQDYRRQLDFSARAMALADTRRDLADSALDQAKKDHAFGAAPQYVVDGAIYTLYQSELNRASARADFLSRWSSFISLVGADPALGLLPAQYVRVHR